MEERHNGIVEVRGSRPLGSTTLEKRHLARDAVFLRPQPAHAHWCSGVHEAFRECRLCVRVLVDLRIGLSPEFSLSLRVCHRRRAGESGGRWR